MAAYGTMGGLRKGRGERYGGIEREGEEKRRVVHAIGEKGGARKRQGIKVAKRDGDKGGSEARKKKPGERRAGIERIGR